MRNTSRVLAWNAVLMMVICVVSIWMAPGWPLAAIYALFALHGITSGAWAGAALAEAGRTAPPGAATAALSGALVYFNTGKMFGPIVFANVYLFSQSYGWAFASLAIPALIAWAVMRPQKTNKKK
jgi:MFS family permease